MRTDATVAMGPAALPAVHCCLDPSCHPLTFGDLAAAYLCATAEAGEIAYLGEAVNLVFHEKNRR
jgi:hypothetical protein